MIASPPLLTRDFALITAGHFLSAVGWGSLLLLPLYLDHLGASRAEIGGLMALASIGGVVLRPLAAWALDVLGRKKTIYVGTALLVTSMVLIGAVTSIGPVLYLDRVLFGVATAALFPGFFTLAADIVPPARRTEGLALFGISGLLPLAFNPFVDQLGIAAADLRWFFPCVGGVILLSLLFIIPVRERAAGIERQPFSVRAALRALSRRQLWSTWTATAVFAGMVSVFFAFATVAGAKRAVANPALIWLSYAGGAAFVRLLGARIPDRVGTHNMVAPSVSLYAVGAVVVAGAWTSEAFLLGGVLAGMGHGYSFPVLSSQVVSRMPEHLRGTGLAMFTALWEAATLSFTPIAGLLADEAGDAVMFSAVAVFAVVSLSAWATLEHRFGPSKKYQIGVSDTAI